MSWRTLDPTAIRSALPEPGEHQAAIIASSLIDKPTELWLQVTVGLRDHAEELKQILCIAAAPESPHRHRVAEGLRTLNRLLAATGRTLKKLTPEAVPPALIGARLTATIAVSEKDGIPELVLRAVSPAREGE